MINFEFSPHFFFVSPMFKTLVLSAAIAATPLMISNADAGCGGGGFYSSSRAATPVYRSATRGGFASPAFRRGGPRTNAGFDPARGFGNSYIPRFGDYSAYYREFGGGIDPNQRYPGIRRPGGRGFGFGGF